MLIQLLPSSGTAEGSRLNNGFGKTASAMPGGTWMPFPPASGGRREPLQYWLITAGFPPRLLLPG
ncbi:hypothetical protein KR99_22795 [Ralstonia solanacearum]|nr:hypothetical protein KR99_22795 [Ralstonia solanacearum]